MSPSTWFSTARTVWRGRRVGPGAAGVDRPTPAPLRPAAPDADGDVWVDFVSDTGDGFHATTTVAWLLAQDVLDVGARSTRRGQLLVHGGDMVYPSGTEAAYRDRFVGPMAAVTTRSSEPRRIAAIPGNHDLHDGSLAWRELLTTGGRIAAWQTEQTETWFAVRLTERWWLWAIDVESSGDMGSSQAGYFRAMAAALGEGAQVVVVVSEPAWLHVDDQRRQRTYRHIADDLVGDHGGRVRLWLSGDSHHYHRFVEPGPEAPVHFVVAGGGGAFLSATHTIPERATFAGDELVVVPTSIYPDRETSRRLVWTAPSLLWRNRSFSVVAALVYAVAGSIRGAAGAWSDTIASVAMAVYAFSLLAGAWLYTANRTWRSVAVAVLHAALHLTVIGGLVAVVERGVMMSALIFGAVGSLAGPLIVGSALILANRLGLNDNELFSAIRVADYRCFVRIRVDADERLTLFPIGVDRITRTWRVDDGESGPVLQPAEPIVVRAIEEPIEIVPDGAA